MGTVSSVQFLRSGEMKIFTCFLIFGCASLAQSQKETSEKPGMGGGGETGGGMRERCCPLKAVESATNASRNEMFVFVETVPWSQIKENCTSNCAYVKMGQLKKIMEEMKNKYNETMEEEKYSTASPLQRMEDKDDQELMQDLMGDKKWMMVKLKLKINRLQKYCFTPSDDVESMCAAPSMDMNALEMIFDMGYKEHGDDKDKEDEEMEEKPEDADEEMEEKPGDEDENVV